MARAAPLKREARPNPALRGGEGERAAEEEKTKLFQNLDYFVLFFFNLSFFLYILVQFFLDPFFFENLEYIFFFFNFSPLLLFKFQIPPCSFPLSTAVPSQIRGTPPGARSIPRRGRCVMRGLLSHSFSSASLAKTARAKRASREPTPCILEVFVVAVF